MSAQKIDYKSFFDSKYIKELESKVIRVGYKPKIVKLKGSPYINGWIEYKTLRGKSLGELISKVKTDIEGIKEPIENVFIENEGLDTIIKVVCIDTMLDLPIVQYLYDLQLERIS